MSMCRKAFRSMSKTALGRSKLVVMILLDQHYPEHQHDERRFELKMSRENAATAPSYRVGHLAMISYWSGRGPSQQSCGCWTSLHSGSPHLEHFATNSDWRAEQPDSNFTHEVFRGWWRRGLCAKSSSPSRKWVESQQPDTSKRSKKRHFCLLVRLLRKLCYVICLRRR